MNERQFRSGCSFHILQLVALLTILCAGTSEARFIGRQAEPVPGADARASQGAPIVKSLPHYREGEVLVRYKKGVSRATAAARMASESLTVSRSYARLSEARGQQLFAVKAAGKTTAQLLTHFRNNPDVETVSPNYLRRIASTTPSDTKFGEMWGLLNSGQTLTTGTTATPGADIKATQAWDRTTGSAGVVIANIDTGITPGHPDLGANLWHNPGEIAGNGIDDDANGYVDDLNGINAIDGNSDVTDLNGHGTHTAGTIAASGNNNQGITGISWQSKIMTLKFADADGTGSDADAIECINYLLDMKSRGVNIVAINASWGGGQYNQILSDAIQAAGDAGIVLVAAAGNDAVNSDSTPHYPAGFNLANIIAVAASDQHDQRAPFSNSGAGSVDLFAPGVDILSTVPGTNPADPGGSYASYSGTSVAAPHVTGALALAASLYPDETVRQRVDRILLTVDTLPQFSGLVASGGRLNLDRALLAQVPVAPHVARIDGVYGANRSLITLQGDTFGQAAGSIVLHGPLTQQNARVVSWSDTSVTFALPEEITPTAMSIRTAAGSERIFAQSPKWSTVPQLSDGLGSRAVVAHNGMMYTFGGENHDHVATDAADVYNPSTNTWAPLAPLNAPQSGLGAAVLNDRIYLVGTATENNQLITTLQEYDPQTDSYTPKAAYVAGRRLTAVATLGNYLYLSGGYSPGNDTATCSLTRYDPLADSWSVLAPMSECRAGHGMVALNGKIWAIGGEADSRAGGMLDSSEVYDPATDSWSPIAPLPSPLGKMGVTTDGTYLYAVGGWMHDGKSERHSTSLFRYDPQANSWVEGPFSLTTPAQLNQAAYAGTSIYSVGGETGAMESLMLDITPGSESLSDAIINDTGIPTGTVIINSGAAATNSAHVTLTMTATAGSGGGVVSRRISKDGGVTWAAGWEPFTTTRNVYLPGSDGTKTITIQLRDMAGNVSPLISDAIILDTVVPTGTVVINGGAAATNILCVALNMTATDGSGSGVVSRRISKDGGVTWAADWEPFTTTRSVNLPSGDGTKTITIQLRDGAGNVSTLISDSIILDTAVPTGTVVINGGAAATNRTANELNMTAADGSGSGVVSRRISKDGGATWATGWEPFTTTRSVGLTGDGTKTITIQLRDGAGNISALISDSIILDTAVPTGTVAINHGLVATNRTTNELNMTAADGSGSGVVSRRISKDGGVTWATGWEPFTTTRDVYLPGSDGTKTITIQLRDGAGNVSALISDTIILDMQRPTGWITINGAHATNNVNAVLSFHSSDPYNGSGVTHMRISYDIGNTWEDWEPYVTTRSTVLTYPNAEDGTKQYAVQFKDAAGNISETYFDHVVLDRVAPTGSILVNVGAEVTNHTWVFLRLMAQDYGLLSMRFSYDGGHVWSDKMSFNKSKTYYGLAVPGGDGVKTVSVQFEDEAGNMSEIYTDTITLLSSSPDRNPPVGTIVINYGIAAHNETHVHLDITGVDDVGVTHFRLSADNINWGPWENYEPVNAHRDMTLPSQNGLIWCYVQFKDAAGNISASFSDSIIFDTDKPSGTMVINGGAATTDSRSVTLTMTATDGSGTGVRSIHIGGDTYNYATQFTTTKTIKLSGGAGVKTISVQFVDGAINKSAIYTDTIILTDDLTPPTGTILINGGEVATNTAEATLNFTASGDGIVSNFRVSADNITWSAWEEVSHLDSDGRLFFPRRITTLYYPTAADGVKTRYVQFKDDVGNISASYSDSIIFDTVAPSGTVVINGGAATTDSTSVTLTMTATDGSGSGVVKRRVSTDGGVTWGTGWEAFTTTRAITLPTGDGVKTVAVQFRDLAGNDSALFSDTITLQTTVSSGSALEQSTVAKYNGVTPQPLPL